LDQPAFSNILFNGTPDAFDFEDAADLEECAQNNLLSIPESLRVALHHLDIVSFETALCGFIKLINSFVVSVRKSFVFCK